MRLSSPGLRRSASLPGRTSTQANSRRTLPSGFRKWRIDRIMLQFKVNKAVKDKNGWAFTTKTGLYGTDYLMRALVTAIGLGANRPQDAVYPTSQKDADGRKYSGANKYVMHFAKGQLPPVSGFWSLTMYDASLFLREQSAQPLLDQRAAESEDQSGRFDRPLYPERIRLEKTRSRTGCLHLLAISF